MRLLLLMIASVFLAAGQAPDPYAFSAPLSASSATCTTVSSCVAFDPRGTAPNAYTAVGIQIAGTWAATIQFEGSIDCSTWFAVSAADASTGANATSTTANGQWIANVSGFCQFRARVSAYTSGIATVTLRPAVQDYAPVNNPNFTGNVTIASPVLSPGIAAKPGDPTGTADSTAALQAILNANAGSTVYLGPGTYRFSALTIPTQTRLQCVGAMGNVILLYTGSGTAIQQQANAADQRMDIAGCKIQKNGAQGGTAIELSGTYYGTIERNWIDGFTTGISADGTLNSNAGIYFDVIRQNVIDHCVTGIYFHGSGLGQANANTIAENVVMHATTGISVAAGSGGNFVVRNNVDLYTGTTAYGYDIGGGSNTVENNWTEADAATGQTFTGFWIHGFYDTMLNNHYYVVGTSGGTGTNVSVVANQYNVTLEPMAGQNILPGLTVYNADAAAPTTTTLRVSPGQSTNPLLTVLNSAGTALGTYIWGDGGIQSGTILGGNIVPGANAYVYWPNKTVLRSPADGQLIVSNYGGTQLATVIVGAGSPEAAITAGIGSLYLRTDGGANTTLYVKQSGTGNTGWAAK